jgi:hypothetical protein
MRNRRRLAVPVAVIALLAAGCGDDDGGQAAPAATASATPSVAAPSPSEASSTSAPQTTAAPSSAATPTSGGGAASAPEAPGSKPGAPGTSGGRTSAPKAGEPLPAPIELDTGVRVELLSSFPAQASDFAQGAEATGGEIGVFTLSMTNDSDARVDLTGAEVTATHGRGNTPAEWVTDLDNGYGSGLLGVPLGPGESTQVDLAFAIPADAGPTITLTVVPAAGQEPVAFTGVSLN